MGVVGVAELGVGHAGEAEVGRVPAGAGDLLLAVLPYEPRGRLDRRHARPPSVRTRILCAAPAPPRSPKPRDRLVSGRAPAEMAAEQRHRVDLPPRRRAASHRAPGTADPDGLLRAGDGDVGAEGPGLGDPVGDAATDAARRGHRAPPRRTCTRPTRCVPCRDPGSVRRRRAGRGRARRARRRPRAPRRSDPAGRGRPSRGTRASDGGSRQAPSGARAGSCGAAASRPRSRRAPASGSSTAANRRTRGRSLTPTGETSPEGKRPRGGDARDRAQPALPTGGRGRARRARRTRARA